MQSWSDLSEHGVVVRNMRVVVVHPLADSVRHGGHQKRLDMQEAVENRPKLVLPALRDAGAVEICS